MIAGRASKTEPPKSRMSSNDLSSLLSSSSTNEEPSMEQRVEGTDDRFSEFLDVRTQRWVVFSRVWNTLIASLREADHMSNLEMDMYKFNIFPWLTKPVYLPLFQTAGCVEQVSNLIDCIPYLHLDYNIQS